MERNNSARLLNASYFRKEKNEVWSKEFHLCYKNSTRVKVNTVKFK